MAKVGYIVVCEEVFNDSDPVIRKPFSAITPYSVPGNFSFVLSFSMFDLEPNVPYKLKLEVIQPNSTNLFVQEMDFDFTPPANMNSVTNGNVNLKFNNVIFKQKGIHTFKVTINGQSTNKLMIPVLPSGQ